MRKPYKREFFALQLDFAHKASVLAGIPLHHAILDYTNLYVRLGFGRDFDPEHEGWRRYVDGLDEADCALGWTYERYLREPESKTAPALVASKGCFSVALPAPAVVRLHFHNCEPQSVSPLAVGREATRREELRGLFREVRARVSANSQVVGASWLYNLERYRRLFPVSYSESARVVQDRFRSMPLWGQFLDRQGNLRRASVESFRSAMQKASTLNSLGSCFPLQVLRAEAPVGEFFREYGLDPLLEGSTSDRNKLGK